MVERVDITMMRMQSIGKAEQLEHEAENESASDALLNQLEEMTNPFAARFQTRQKEIKTRYTRISKMLESRDKAERILAVERRKDLAEQFQQRNSELRAKTLMLLREAIKPGDTMEDILRKLREFYEDPSIADEALEYLLQTTEGDLYRTVEDAKVEHNRRYGREIIAGHNIGTVARKAAEKGLGTPTSLRDMYRDITGNPRDSATLFDELVKQYAYSELKRVIQFLLHSLGTDMKSKGPSIERALLHRLFTETRSLQAILGVYNFFRSRMRLIQSLFVKNELMMPPQLSFEMIAKQFMELVADRYPSSSKVLQRAVRLGIDRWIIAKIIVISQMRDAVREVAVNYIYKSLQHRDDLYLAILEALEDLEDELEEFEEKEGKQQQEKEKEQQREKERQKKDQEAHRDKFVA